MELDRPSALVRRSKLCLWLGVFALSAAVVQAQMIVTRTLTPATPGDPDACPVTLPTGPVDVTIQGDLDGLDPGEAVTVVEEVTGDGVSSATIVAGGGAQMEDSNPRQVGIFDDSRPLATQVWGVVEPGCIGEPGEWSATYDAGTDEYTLADSWGDIWQEGDTFTFAYSQVRGDFTLTARIAERNPHPFCRWGRNGLMIRQDLTNASRLNLIFDNLWGEEAIAAGGNGGQSEQKLTWGYRRVHGNVGSITPNQETQLDGDWLQIERSGDTMIGYFSQDGANWTELKRSTWSEAPEAVLVGLALSGRAGPGGEDSGAINCDDLPTRVTYDEVELVLADGAKVVPLGGGQLGTEITWNTTRAEIAAGLDYRVEVKDSGLTFQGNVDGDAIGGDTAIDVVAGGVGPICSTERSFLPGEDCADGRPRIVVVQHSLQGRNPDEVVVVTERVAGAVSPEQVTASNGGVIESGPFGGAPVGTFQTATPLATQFWGPIEPGCLGEPGEWSATYDPGTDQYTLEDSWGDIWREGDTFTYAYSQVQGDFSLTAHIVERNPHPFCRWGRNGLLIRQDLTNASRLNLIFDNLWGQGAIDAGTGGQHEQKLTWGNRPSHGTASSIANAETQNDGDWLQIQRSGDTMIGQYSVDGVTWDELNRSTWSAAPDTVLVGLALSGRVAPGNGNGGEPNCADPPSRVTYDEVELVLGDGAEIVPLEGAGFGVDITWNVTRRALDEGLSYSIDIPAGDLTFDGGVDGVATDGPRTTTIVPCPAERTLAACPAGGGPLSVTIAQPLSGGDPDEMVELREVVRGQVSANDVTANGALVSDETLSGVGIFGEAVPLATQFWGAVEPGCIGQPGQWSATYDPGTDEYTLEDSWGDIWQEGDTFTFAHSQVKGDFTLTAHIAERNPHPWCRWGRNGLMIRQDLTNASRLNLIFDNLWGEGASAADTTGQSQQGLTWGNRRIHGDVASITPNEETNNDGDWLQIERSGDTMIGYYSQDGVNWIELNQTTWLKAPETVLVGLALSGRAGPGGADNGNINCDDPPTRVTYDEVEFVLADGAEVVRGARVEITWNLPRSALAAGMSYEVAGPAGTPVELQGFSAGQRVAGPEDAVLCGGGGGGGGGQFRRGDANSDAAVNLADAVAIFNFLFLGGDEPTCLDASDTNDADDALNLTDGVYLLNFLFLGGDPIPDPGPFDCGPEPAGSPITFGCESSPCP